MPPIFMKGGTSMVMSPNILEVMSFRLGLFYPVTSTTVVCCILMQILCVVSQKKLQLLGDFRPQTISLLLCPPNNPVGSTPLVSFVLGRGSKSALCDFLVLFCSRGHLAVAPVSRETSGKGRHQDPVHAVVSVSDS